MVLLILIGANIVFFTKNYMQISSNSEDTTPYIDSDEEFIYDDFTHKITNIDDLLNDKINGLIYIGRDTCPNCLTFNEFLQEEFDRNKNLLIYKFDTDYWREDERFQNILDKFEIEQIPVLIRVEYNKSYDEFLFDENIIDKDTFQKKLNEFIYQ